MTDQSPDRGPECAPRHESDHGHGPASISDREVGALETAREDPPSGPAACLSCGIVPADGVRLARGLDIPCYHKHRRAGDLDRFPIPARKRRRRPARAKTLPEVEGVSYRQLDYWARQGYLRPERNNSGTGYWRTWPAEEVRVAQLMGRLVTHGLMAHVAEKVARGETEIGPGVRVVVAA